MDKRAYKLTLRTVAMVVVGVFTTTTVAWSVPDAAGLFVRSGASTLGNTEVHESTWAGERWANGREITENIPLLAPLRETGGAGTVRRAHVPADATELPERFVIYIHDAHADPVAQESTRAIIDAYARRFGVTTILSEGGTGEAAVSKIRDFPYPELTKETAGQYLERADLTGAEFEAMTGAHAYRFFGIEDESLYRAHLETFFESERVRAENERKSAKWLRRAEKMRKSVYNKELFAFDELVRAGWKSNADDLFTFTAALASRARKAGINFFHLTELRRVLRMHVLSALLSLPWAGSGANDRARYQKKLDELASDVDAESLERETGELVRRVKEKLFKNARERDLDRRLTFLRLTGKLVRLEMTPADWRAYREMKADLEGLPGLESRPAEAFYAQAEARDKALVRNALELIEENKHATLITGGFHGPEIEHALAGRGISFVSILPRVSDEPGKSRYLDRMAREAAETSNLMPRLLLLHPDRLDAFLGDRAMLARTRFGAAALENMEDGDRSFGDGASTRWKGRPSPDGLPRKLQRAQNVGGGLSASRLRSHHVRVLQQAAEEPSLFEFGFGAKGPPGVGQKADAQVRNFAMRLGRALADRKLKWPEFARAMKDRHGISVNSGLLNGTSLPKANTVYYMALELGKTVDELLKTTSWAGAGAGLEGETFGERLREARALRDKLPQAGLSAASGVLRTTIVYLESADGIGGRWPTFENWIRLSAALGMSPGQLLGELKGFGSAENEPDSELPVRFDMGSLDEWWSALRSIDVKKYVAQIIGEVERQVREKSRDVPEVDRVRMMVHIMRGHLNRIWTWILDLDISAGKVEHFDPLPEAVFKISMANAEKIEWFADRVSQLMFAVSEIFDARESVQGEDHERQDAFGAFVSFLIGSRGEPEPLGALMDDFLDEMDPPARRTVEGILIDFLFNLEAIWRETNRIFLQVKSELADGRGAERTRAAFRALEREERESGEFTSGHHEIKGALLRIPDHERAQVFENRGEHTPTTGEVLLTFVATELLNFSLHMKLRFGMMQNWRFENVRQGILYFFEDHPMVRLNDVDAVLRALVNADIYAGHLAPPAGFGAAARTRSDAINARSAESPAVQKISAQEEREPGRPPAGFGARPDSLEAERALLLGELSAMEQAELESLRKLLRYGVHRDVFRDLPAVKTASEALKDDPGELAETLRILYEESRQYIYEFGMRRHVQRTFPKLLAGRLVLSQPPLVGVDPIAFLNALIPEHVRRVIGVDFSRIPFPRGNELLSLIFPSQDEVRVTIVAMDRPEMAGAVTKLIEEVLGTRKKAKSSDAAAVWEKGHIRSEVTSELARLSQADRAAFRETLRSGLHPDLHSTDIRSGRDVIDLERVYGVKTKGVWDPGKYLFFPSPSQGRNWIKDISGRAPIIGRAIRTVLGTGDPEPQELDLGDRNPTALAVRMKYPENAGDLLSIMDEIDNAADLRSGFGAAARTRSGAINARSAASPAVQKISAQEERESNRPPAGFGAPGGGIREEDIVRWAEHADLDAGVVRSEMVEMAAALGSDAAFRDAFLGRMKQDLFDLGYLNWQGRLRLRNMADIAKRLQDVPGAVRIPVGNNFMKIFQTFFQQTNFGEYKVATARREILTDQLFSMVGRFGELSPFALDAVLHLSASKYFPDDLPGDSLRLISDEMMTVVNASTDVDAPGGVNKLRAAEALMRLGMLADGGLLIGTYEAKRDRLSRMVEKVSGLGGSRMNRALRILLLLQRDGVFGGKEFEERFDEAMKRLGRDTPGGNDRPLERLFELGGDGLIKYERFLTKIIVSAGLEAGRIQLTRDSKGAVSVDYQRTAGRPAENRGLIFSRGGRLLFDMIKAEAMISGWKQAALPLPLEGFFLWPLTSQRTTATVQVSVRYFDARGGEDVSEEIELRVTPAAAGFGMDEDASEEDAWQADAVRRLLSGEEVVMDRSHSELPLPLNALRKFAEISIISNEVIGHTDRTLKPTFRNQLVRLIPEVHAGRPAVRAKMEVYMGTLYAALRESSNFADAAAAFKEDLKKKESESEIVPGPDDGASRGPSIWGKGLRGLSFQWHAAETFYVLRGPSVSLKVTISAVPILRAPTGNGFGADDGADPSEDTAGEVDAREGAHRKKKMSAEEAEAWRAEGWRLILEMREARGDLEKADGTAAETAAKSRWQEAATRFIAHIRSAVFGAVYKHGKMLLSDFTAEEIVDEIIFFVATDVADSFDPEGGSDLTSWIYTKARSRLGRLKAEKLRRDRTRPLSLDVPMSDDERNTRAGAATEVDQAQRTGQMKGAAKFSEDDRRHLATVRFLLRYADGDETRLMDTVDALERNEKHRVRMIAFKLMHGLVDGELRSGVDVADILYASGIAKSPDGGPLSRERIRQFVEQAMQRIFLALAGSRSIAWEKLSRIEDERLPSALVKLKTALRAEQERHVAPRAAPLPVAVHYQRASESAEAEAEQAEAAQAERLNADEISTHVFRILGEFPERFRNRAGKPKDLVEKLWYEYSINVGEDIFSGEAFPDTNALYFIGKMTHASVDDLLGTQAFRGKAPRLKNRFSHSFRDPVEALMADHGMDRAALRIRAGLDEETMEKILTNRGKVLDLETLIRLALALGLSPGQMLATVDINERRYGLKANGPSMLHRREGEDLLETKTRKALGRFVRNALEYTGNAREMAGHLEVVSGRSESFNPRHFSGELYPSVKLVNKVAGLHWGALSVDELLGTTDDQVNMAEYPDYPTRPHERVQYLLKRLNVTPEEAARTSGLSLELMQGIFDGRYDGWLVEDLTFPSLIRLAWVLKISPGQLIEPPSSHAFEPRTTSPEPDGPAPGDRDDTKDQTEARPEDDTDSRPTPAESPNGPNLLIFPAVKRRAVGFGSDIPIEQAIERLAKKVQMETDELRSRIDRAVQFAFDFDMEASDKFLNVLLVDAYQNGYFDKYPGGRSSLLRILHIARNFPYVAEHVLRVAMLFPEVGNNFEWYLAERLDAFSKRPSEAREVTNALLRFSDHDFFQRGPSLRLNSDLFFQMMTDVKASLVEAEAPPEVVDVTYRRLGYLAQTGFFRDVLSAKEQLESVVRLIKYVGGYRAPDLLTEITRIYVLGDRPQTESFAPVLREWITRSREIKPDKFLRELRSAGAEETKLFNALIDDRMINSPYEYKVFDVMFHRDGFLMIISQTADAGARPFEKVPLTKEVAERFFIWVRIKAMIDIAKVEKNTIIDRSFDHFALPPDTGRAATGVLANLPPKRIPYRVEVMLSRDDDEGNAFGELMNFKVTKKGFGARNSRPRGTEGRRKADGRLMSMSRARTLFDEGEWVNIDRVPSGTFRSPVSLLSGVSTITIEAIVGEEQEGPFRREVAVLKMFAGAFRELDGEFRVTIDNRDGVPDTLYYAEHVRPDDNRLWAGGGEAKFELVAFAWHQDSTFLVKPQDKHRKAKIRIRAERGQRIARPAGFGAAKPVRAVPSAVRMNRATNNGKKKEAAKKMTVKKRAEDKDVVSRQGRTKLAVKEPAAKSRRKKTAMKVTRKRPRVRPEKRDAPDEDSIFRSPAALYPFAWTWSVDADNETSMTNSGRGARQRNVRGSSGFGAVPRTDRAESPMEQSVSAQDAREPGKPSQGFGAFPRTDRAGSPMEQSVSAQDAREPGKPSQGFGAYREEEDDVRISPAPHGDVRNGEVWQTYLERFDAAGYVERKMASHAEGIRSIHAQAKNLKSVLEQPYAAHAPGADRAVPPPITTFAFWRSTAGAVFTYVFAGLVYLFAVPPAILFVTMTVPTSLIGPVLAGAYKAHMLVASYVLLLAYAAAAARLSVKSADEESGSFKSRFKRAFYFLSWILPLVILIPLDLVFMLANKPVDLNHVYLFVGGYVLLVQIYFTAVVWSVRSERHARRLEREHQAAERKATKRQVLESIDALKAAHREELDAFFLAWMYAIRTYSPGSDLLRLHLAGGHRKARREARFALEHVQANILRSLSLAAYDTQRFANSATYLTAARLAGPLIRTELKLTAVLTKLVAIDVIEAWAAIRNIRGKGERVETPIERELREQFLRLLGTLADVARKDELDLEPLAAFLDKLKSAIMPEAAVPAETEQALSDADPEGPFIMTKDKIYDAFTGVIDESDRKRIFGDDENIWREITDDIHARFLEITGEMANWQPIDARKVVAEVLLNRRIDAADINEAIQLILYAFAKHKILPERSIQPAERAPVRSTEETDRPQQSISRESDGDRRVERFTTARQDIADALNEKFGDRRGDHRTTLENKRRRADVFGEHVNWSLLPTEVHIYFAFTLKRTQQTPDMRQWSLRDVHDGLVHVLTGLDVSEKHFDTAANTILHILARKGWVTDNLRPPGTVSGFGSQVPRADVDRLNRMMLEGNWVNLRAFPRRRAIISKRDLARVHQIRVRVTTGMGRAEYVELKPSVENERTDISYTRTVVSENAETGSTGRAPRPEGPFKDIIFRNDRTWRGTGGRRLRYVSVSWRRESGDLFIEQRRAGPTGTLQIDFGLQRRPDRMHEDVAQYRTVDTGFPALPGEQASRESELNFTGTDWSFHRKMFAGNHISMAMARIDPDRQSKAAHVFFDKWFGPGTRQFAVRPARGGDAYMGFVLQKGNYLPAAFMWMDKISKQALIAPMGYFRADPDRIRLDAIDVYIWARERVLGVPENAALAADHFSLNRIFYDDSSVDVPKTIHAAAGITLGNVRAGFGAEDGKGDGRSNVDLLAGQVPGRGGIKEDAATGPERIKAPSGLTADLKSERSGFGKDGGHSQDDNEIAPDELIILDLIIDVSDQIARDSGMTPEAVEAEIEAMQTLFDNADDPEEGRPFLEALAGDLVPTGFFQERGADKIQFIFGLAAYFARRESESETWELWSDTAGDVVRIVARLYAQGHFRDPETVMGELKSFYLSAAGVSDYLNVYASALFYLVLALSDRGYFASSDDIKRREAIFGYAKRMHDIFVGHDKAYNSIYRPLTYLARIGFFSNKDGALRFERTVRSIEHLFQIYGETFDFYDALMTLADIHKFEDFNSEDGAARLDELFGDVELRGLVALEARMEPYEHLLESYKTASKLIEKRAGKAGILVLRWNKAAERLTLDAYASRSYFDSVSTFRTTEEAKMFFRLFKSDLQLDIGYPHMPPERVRKGTYRYETHLGRHIDMSFKIVDSPDGDPLNEEIILYTESVSGFGAAEFDREVPGEERSGAGSSSPGSGEPDAREESVDPVEFLLPYFNFSRQVLERRIDALARREEWRIAMHAFKIKFGLGEYRRPETGAPLTNEHVASVLFSSDIILGRLQSPGKYVDSLIDVAIRELFLSVFPEPNRKAAVAAAVKELSSMQDSDLPAVLRSFKAERPTGFGAALHELRFDGTLIFHTTAKMGQDTLPPDFVYLQLDEPGAGPRAFLNGLLREGGGDESAEGILTLPSGGAFYMGLRRVLGEFEPASLYFLGEAGENFVFPLLYNALPPHGENTLLTSGAAADEFFGREAAHSIFMYVHFLRMLFGDDLIPNRIVPRAMSEVIIYDRFESRIPNDVGEQGRVAIFDVDTESGFGGEQSESREPPELDPLVATKVTDEVFLVADEVLWAAQAVQRLKQKMGSARSPEHMNSMLEQLSEESFAAAGLLIRSRQEALLIAGSILLLPKAPPKLLKSGVLDEYAQDKERLALQMKQFFRRGHILIPQERARTWPLETIRYVLAHELLHKLFDKVLSKSSGEDVVELTQSFEEAMTDTDKPASLSTDRSTEDIRAGRILGALAEEFTQYYFPDQFDLLDANGDVVAKSFSDPDAEKEYRKAVEHHNRERRKKLDDDPAMTAMYDHVVTEAGAAARLVAEALGRLDASKDGDAGGQSGFGKEAEQILPRTTTTLASNSGFGAAVEFSSQVQPNIVIADAERAIRAGDITASDLVKAGTGFGAPEDAGWDAFMAEWALDREGNARELLRAFEGRTANAYWQRLVDMTTGSVNGSAYIMQKRERNPEAADRTVQQTISDKVSNKLRQDVVKAWKRIETFPDSAEKRGLVKWFSDFLGDLFNMMNDQSVFDAWGTKSLKSIIGDYTLRAEKILDDREAAFMARTKELTADLTPDQILRDEGNTLQTLRNEHYGDVLDTWYERYPSLNGMSGWPLENRRAGLLAALAGTGKTFRELDYEARVIEADPVLAPFLRNREGLHNPYYLNALRYSFLVSEEARTAFRTFVEAWRAAERDTDALLNKKRLRQPVHLFLSVPRTRHQTARFIENMVFDDAFWNPGFPGRGVPVVFRESNDPSFFWYYLAPLFDAFLRHPSVAGEAEAARRLMYFHNRFDEITEAVFGDPGAPDLKRPRVFDWDDWLDGKEVIDERVVDSIVRETTAHHDASRAGFGAAVEFLSQAQPSIVIADAERAIRAGDITASDLVKAGKGFGSGSRIHLVFADMATGEQASEFIERAFGTQAVEVFPFISIHTAESAALAPSAAGERRRHYIISEIAAASQDGKTVVVDDFEHARDAGGRKGLRYLLCKHVPEVSSANLLGNARLIGIAGGAEEIKESVVQGIERLDAHRWLNTATRARTDAIAFQMEMAAAFDVAA